MGSTLAATFCSQKVAYAEEGNFLPPNTRDIKKFMVSP